MKIALINESSCLSKNAAILRELERVVKPLGHQVFNYGMSEEDKDYNISYVELGYLTAILLNAGAVDFVVTGCASGEGACMVSNSYPNVYCGYIKDPVDAYMFGQINDGNAISMPFGKDFGVGGELNLRYVFQAYFQSEHGMGYPESRAQLQRDFKTFFEDMKSCIADDMGRIILRSRPDVTKRIIQGKVFQREFLKNAADNPTTDAIRRFMSGAL